MDKIHYCCSCQLVHKTLPGHVQRKIKLQPLKDLVKIKQLALINKAENKLTVERVSLHYFHFFIEISDEYIYIYKNSSSNVPTSLHYPASGKFHQREQKKKKKASDG